MGSGSSGYGIGGGGGGGNPRSDPPSGAADGGFKGGTDSWQSVGDNLSDLKDNYDYRDGYFGDPSAPKKPRIRHIEGDDPVSTARDFYDRATQGGIEEPLPNGKGVKTTMSDGTVITMREVSSSDGSPAVDINISRSSGTDGIKGQKIHFVQGEGE